MANYRRRQTSLWDQLPEVDPPGLEDVKAFLDVLSEFDEPLVRELERRRGNGRDDYPVVPMWNLFAIMHYLRRARRSAVLEELKRNARLAKLLGFERKPDGHYRLPPQWACTRFEQTLRTPEIQEMLNAIVGNTVKELKEEIPDLGEHAAADASDIPAWAKPPSRDGTRPSSDEDASWSVKTKTSVNEKGEVVKKTKATFGYKLYAVVDVKRPVVLAISTQTGSTNDHAQVPSLLRQTVKNVGVNTVKTLAMDKGFDSTDVVTACYDYDIKAVVPFRDVPQNLEQLPPEDREVPLEPGSNVVRDRYTGQVCCYDFSSPEPRRQELVYAGFDASRNAHKFRCPAGALGSSCPYFDRCSAGRNGEESRQVRIPMRTDPRRFAPIYPRSSRWKRLMRGRTAVERYNSYVKEVLRLEDHCVRGKAAVHLRVVLCALTVNLGTLLKTREARCASRVAA